MIGDSMTDGSSDGRPRDPMRTAFFTLVIILLCTALAVGFTFALNALVSSSKPPVSAEDTIVAAVANGFVEECTGDLALQPYFLRWDKRDAIVTLAPIGAPHSPATTLRVRDDGWSYHVIQETPSDRITCPPFDVQKT